MISIELVQLGEPEVIAAEIRIRRQVRISLQVAEILHQNESPVEFSLREGRVLSDVPQRPSAGVRVGARGGGTELINRRLPVAGGRCNAGMAKERVNKL